MTFLRETYRHSAWSANLFLGHPGLWVWRQGFEKWGEDSPRAMMGHVIEDIVSLYFYWGEFSFADLLDIPLIAKSWFLAIFYKEARRHWMNSTHGLIDDEMDNVAPIALNMLIELDQWNFGKFIAAQVRTPKDALPQFKGLNTPCRATVDLMFEAGDIDLKATLRCPSEPSANHLRQMALYALLRGRPQWLLYATPKRARMFEVHPSDVVHYGQQVLDAFRQIERLNRRYERVKSLTALYPLNPDDFQWDNPEEYQEARKVWDAS